MSEQKVVKSAKNKEDVYLELQKLQAEYNNKSAEFKPKKLELEKKSYTAPSDDELLKLAKAYVDKKNKSVINNLNNSANEKRKKLSESIEKAFSDAENKNKMREVEYENAFNNLENQLIKRGVQRSSVAIGELGKLHENKLAESDKAGEELSNKVKSLENQIADVENELSKSLKNLDMQSAVEINDKLMNLKQERQKNIDEVIEFNNKVTEAETKYNGEKHEVVDEEGLKNLNRDYNRKKLSTVINYYLSYENPVEALNDFVSDEEIEKYLGDYYDYAYNVIKNLT